MLNPLSEERSVMRTSLLPGLLNNLQHAQRYQEDRLCLFELARSYFPLPNAELPSERYSFDFVLCGPKKEWITENEEMDFFDGKGLIINLLRRQYAVDPIVYRNEELENELAFLHPKKSAIIKLAELDIGHVGVLHPDVAEAFELRGQIVYASIALDALILVEKKLRLPQAKSLPKFPHSTRDIALLVKEEITLETVMQNFDEQNQKLIEKVELFDLYRGNQLPEQHKSLALRIYYRDPENTLTDKAIDKLHGQVTQALAKRLDGSLR
ncbi:MAG: hypothetical protein IPJ88_09645 [Myxococcales bacterium]|nr:MAG: hypothetical protein IPJ88_09645 [Myxococcales bacterium]